MILVHNVDWFTSADTFSSTRVFVPVFLTVEEQSWHTYPIYGSGTKLFVTDEQVVKPVVSVYPAASRAHLEGRSSLLCLASAMFPPLVQFSWKRQKEGGPLEELPPAEGEQLELTEPGRSAAILLVDRGAFYTYKYHCYVKHEGGTVKAQTAQERVHSSRADSHYQHCVEQTEQLHLHWAERIQGNHCNREGVKEKPVSAVRSALCDRVST
ncbi:hypothetical protein INR49_007162 [Caranx melampygus]|nr:hypothetical protein INR49_007162 [Caranx melampygus]